MRDYVYCEECIYVKLKVHDPKRTGEPIYDPYYMCCFCNGPGTHFMVHADDFCSHGVKKIPERGE